MGRHAPRRDRALLDLDLMIYKGHCKRCGVPMERSSASAWRLQDGDSAGGPIESATKEGRAELRLMASVRRAGMGA